MTAQRSSAREFSWSIRIYYEDTDAGGIVYHANYLKYMERARTEWLRQLGYEQDELARSAGIFFVVKKIAIDYQSPARFNDEVDVRCQILRCGRASIDFEQTILRQKESLAVAQIKVGCVSTRSLSPQAMPRAIYSEFNHVAH